MKYIKNFEEKILKLADTPLFTCPKIKRNAEWGIKSEKILKYFKVGRVFNVGRVTDRLSAVKKVEILK